MRQAASPGVLDAVPTRLPRPFRRSWRLFVLALVCMITPLGGGVLADRPSNARLDQVAVIREHGARIAPVEVVEVLSVSPISRSNTFGSTLIVEVPDAHGEMHRVRVEVARTIGRPEPGEHLSALYSPADPSLGVIIDDGNLEGLLGGPSRMWILLAVMWGVTCLGLVWLLAALSELNRAFRKLRAGVRARRAVGTEVSIQGSGACQLTVKVGQQRDTRQVIEPALLGTAGNATVHLIVDRHLDASVLAEDLGYGPVWLCWLPEHKRLPGNTVAAVLITADGQTLWVRVPEAELDTLSAGPLPWRDTPARPFGPYNVWRQRVHPAGVPAVVVGFLAAVAQAAFTPAGLASWLLWIVIALSPATATLLWYQRRTRLLKNAQETATV
ncbi:hypothetical protein TH66_12185 [Carbonactinospora thermoautotrophica]|uniref:Uncharacterized protein n=1 Tax=Carbonactinospora thermoautotrophica TaxID=1469144 RepID=A0A132NFT7_9ACTN|nr:hypothetical protein TH66_12185 [Carbonactinospora thermoautotrophica]KWX08984.1 hypothetical protein TR74_12360 [Carbonactinospora thermoautotrophica]